MIKQKAEFLLKKMNDFDRSIDELQEYPNLTLDEMWEEIKEFLGDIVKDENIN